MVDGFRLASDSVGSIFAISETNWTVISKRVGLTILTKDIVSTVARFLPTFPDLLAACEGWKGSTFPGLVDRSRSVSDYASRAIQNVTRLQTLISHLDPNRPLSGEEKQEAEATLDDLARSSGEQAKVAGDLAGQVQRFTTANQAVDVEIRVYQERLGSEWQSLAATLREVDEATGTVTGAWQAIADDLGRVASGRIAVTTPFLLGLDIASALRAWNNIKSEADAFASMSEGQWYYLTGQWLVEHS
jgi:hypothetical protein